MLVSATYLHQLSPQVKHPLLILLFRTQVPYVALIKEMVGPFTSLQKEVVHRVSLSALLYCVSYSVPASHPLFRRPASLTQGLGRNSCFQYAAPQQSLPLLRLDVAPAPAVQLSRCNTSENTWVRLLWDLLDGNALLAVYNNPPTSTQSALQAKTPSMYVKQRQQEGTYSSTESQPPP